MNNKYINIYNNIVNLTRNKNLYSEMKKQDDFSDRLIFFLFHFGFFLKSFKKRTDKKELQDIYDYCFRQLELSIREIGYSDVTINKKMKIYINTFHSILGKIENWDNVEKSEKSKIFENYLNISLQSDYLAIYFDKFYLDLSKNTLNYYLKDAIK